MNQQAFIAIIVIAVLLLLLFVCGCVKFAKWYIFPKRLPDQPAQPLMSQIISYGSSDSSEYERERIERYEHTERENNYYHTPVYQYPDQPQQAAPVPQMVYQPQPQNAAPTGEDRAPGRPETPVYQPPVTPNYQPPAQAPYYTPLPQQPVTPSPDYSAAQPGADDPYSEQEPTRPAPTQPYYQPWQDVDFYDNTPAPRPAPQEPYYTPTPQAAQPVQDDWPFPEHTPAPIQPIAPPMEDYTGFDDIPPYPMPAQPGYYPEPEYSAFDVPVTPALDVTGPLETPMFQLPSAFTDLEMPQASYPTLPTIVDADPSYTEQE